MNVENTSSSTESNLDRWVNFIFQYSNYGVKAYPNGLSREECTELVKNYWESYFFASESYKDHRKTLITLDGRGKGAKAEALEHLLQAAREGKI